MVLVLVGLGLLCEAPRSYSETHTQ